MKQLNIVDLETHEQIIASKLEKVDNTYYLLAIVAVHSELIGKLKCYISDNGIDFNQKPIYINERYDVKMANLDLVKIDNDKFLLYIVTAIDDTEELHVIKSKDLLNWNNEVKLVTIEGISQYDIYDFKIVKENNVFKVIISATTSSIIKLFSSISQDGIHFHSSRLLPINKDFESHMFISGIVKNNSFYYIYCNVTVGNVFTTQVYLSSDLNTFLYLKELKYVNKNIRNVNNVSDSEVYITLIDRETYHGYTLNNDELLKLTT